MKKQIISLGLASTLLIGSVAFGAETKNIENEVTSQEVSVISEKLEKESKYINYRGKITTVNKDEGNVSVVVERLSEEDTFESIKFNISEDTVLLSDETKDFIDSKKLVEGAIVDVNYNRNSPMTKSLPPMTNADVLILKEAKEDKQTGIKVGAFGKDQISEDNFLKYNITKDTVIVDKKGNKLNEEDLHDKDLVVFYGPAMTMSIPGQSNAVKIIGLFEKTAETPEVPEENTEIKVLDKIIYTKIILDTDATLSVDMTLKNKIYKSGDTFMIPLREIAEPLGYKVSWNNKSRQAELTKGSNYLTVTERSDIYSFAKMTVKLEKASEIKDGRTFVPLSFIEEVMQLEMNVDKDGVINIK